MTRHSELWPRGKTKMHRIMKKKKKIQKLLDDMIKYQKEKEEEGRTLYNKLAERYPYEYYGIDGQMKIEEKMKKYTTHMQVVNVSIIGLENLLFSIDEEMKKYADKQ